MSTTVKIYPTTTAHQYWRNTTWTQGSPYTRAYAGTASYTYLWPIPFNLSAYASKVLVSMKLKVKVDDASNTFGTGEYIGAGLATSNSSSSDAANCTHLNSNEHLPTISGDTWNEWNIADAWNTLKSGAAYIVMYANEYAVMFTNYDTVAAADRPYIELVYNEPLLVNIDGGSTWKSGTKMQVNITEQGNNFKEVTKLQVYDGASWKTAF